MSQPEQPLLAEYRLPPADARYDISRSRPERFARKSLI
jgi:hypothetical protein